MMDDPALLRRYVREGDHEAFAELVRRHLDLVYSVALRQVGGDAHLAKDTAQVTFAALAKKAGALLERPTVGGWLYRTAQFTAIDTVRRERRRRAREQEAFDMSEITRGTDETDWDKVRPLLDRAIGELGEADRDAVVMRFIHGCSFGEVGARLRLTENAARMRVERALDKLHAVLSRHGVRSTAAAVATALVAQAGTAAPIGLAGTVTAGALASGAATGVGAWVGFMGATKLQIGAAAAIAVAGGTGYWAQANDQAELRREIAQVQAATPSRLTLDQERGRLVATAAEVADLRRDDVELARLRDEADALRGQVKARVEAAKAAPATKVSAKAADGSGTTYPLKTLDVKPTVIFQARPIYPQSLRASGERHEVVLDFKVDVDGTVADLKTVRSTHPEIAEAGAEAVKKWQFMPGEKSGLRVNTRMQMPIVFTMSKEPVVAQPWFNP